MPAKIRFSCVDFQMNAVLDDSPVAKAVLENLPLEGIAETTGASLYFFVDIQVPDDGAVEEVEEGAIAYWPAANSLCVFYGGRPTTPVVVVGKLEGDPRRWLKIMSGQVIRVDKG